MGLTEAGKADDEAGKELMKAGRHLQVPFPFGPEGQLADLLKRLEDSNDACKSRKAAEVKAYKKHNDGGIDCEEVRPCHRTPQCNHGDPIGNDCKSTSPKTYATLRQALYDADFSALWKNRDKRSLFCAHRHQSLCHDLWQYCTWSREDEKCRPRGAVDVEEGGDRDKRHAQRVQELERLQREQSAKNYGHLSEIVANTASEEFLDWAYEAPTAAEAEERRSGVYRGVPAVFHKLLNYRDPGGELLTRYDVPLWHFYPKLMTPRNIQQRIYQFSAVPKLRTLASKIHEALMKDKRKMYKNGYTPEALTEFAEHILLRQPFHGAEKAREDFLADFFTTVPKDYTRYVEDYLNPVEKQPRPPSGPGMDGYTTSASEYKGPTGKKNMSHSFHMEDETKHVLGELLAAYIMKAPQQMVNLWLDTTAFPAAIILRDPLGRLVDSSVGSRDVPAALHGALRPAGSKRSEPLTATKLYPWVFQKYSAEDGPLEVDVKRAKKHLECVVIPRIIGVEHLWHTQGAQPRPKRKRTADTEKRADPFPVPEYLRQPERPRPASKAALQDDPHDDEGQDAGSGSKRSEDPPVVHGFRSEGGSSSSRSAPTDVGVGGERGSSGSINTAAERRGGPEKITEDDLLDFWRGTPNVREPPKRRSKLTGNSHPLFGVVFPNRPP